jgi:galactokinase
LKDFAAIFGGEPEVSAAAPGRVNLLGEHTDYNEGFVLPTTIPQRTVVAIRRAARNVYTVHSGDLEATAQFTLDSPPEQHFASYVYGCVRIAALESGRTEPLDIHVKSEVPIGVGLSSSAALEVATLRGLRALDLLDAEDATIAELAQRAEIEYAGVHCGILDQMASSLLTSDSMLFLDTRTFERRLLPLPPESEVLVIDSGISRSLASSKYNERRAECQEAAHRLGCNTLRDVSEAGAVERLPDPFRKRARHVLAENERVLRAVAVPCAQAFGQLMNASHESLRDDYEVSISALDDLARILKDDNSVFGAKLTGAGFGGACVALCAAGHAARVGRRALKRYDTEERSGRVLVPPS